MTESPKTIAREKLLEAVKTLGLDPEEITQIYMDTDDIDVFYVDKNNGGMTYELIKVV